MTPIVVPMPMSDGSGPSGPLPWWGWLVICGISTLLGVMFLAMSLDLREMSYGYSLSDRLMNGAMYAITAVLFIVAIVSLAVPVWRFIT